MSRSDLINAVLDMQEELRGQPMPSSLPSFKALAPDLSEGALAERIAALLSENPEVLVDTVMRFIEPRPWASSRDILSWWLRGCP